MFERTVPFPMPALLSIVVAATMCLAPDYVAAQVEDSAAAAVTPTILDNRGRTISAYPYAYYTPETELAFGAGGIMTFYTSQIDPELRPSKVTLSGYYSTRGQYKISQETQLYLDENRYLVVVPLSFGSFVEKYWGAGNQAMDIDSVDYDVNVIDGSVIVEGVTGLSGFTRDGFVYRGSYRSITDTRGNPNLTDSTLGVEGGFTSGFGFNMVVDNRDHIFYPTQGGFHRIYFVWYSKMFGSQYRFSQLEMDLRRYVRVSSSQVFAAHIAGEFVFGEVPFYDLPLMGGGRIMRGYYEGRYRDQSYVAMQAEFRQHVWWRFGLVAFAGLGEVFGSEQSGKALSTLKYSVGGGLRFLFNRRQNINLRADIGFGRDGNSGLYFGLEEAF